MGELSEKVSMMEDLIERFRKMHSNKKGLCISCRKNSICAPHLRYLINAITCGSYIKRSGTLNNDFKDTKYVECSECGESFRNRYRCEDYKAPSGYDYRKCPDCNEVKDKRFKE